MEALLMAVGILYLNKQEGCQLNQKTPWLPLNEEKQLAC